MKIKPFGTLVLVEKIGEEKINTSGIILPQDSSSFFAKFKILAVGDKMTNHNLIEGKVVLAHDLAEYIGPGGKIGFLSENHIFGEVEE